MGFATPRLRASESEYEEEIDARLRIASHPQKRSFEFLRGKINGGRSYLVAGGEGDLMSLVKGATAWS